MSKLFYAMMMVALFLGFGLIACGGSESSTQPAEEAAPAAPVEEEAEAVAGDPVLGQELYIKSCVACHGAAGEGVQGLGKDMTSSEFIQGKTDEELIEFIKVGRDPSDPLNTTGVAMPSKGGDPTLTDEKMLHIVAFMRSIQK